MNRIHELAEQEGQPLITGNNFLFERELGEVYDSEDDQESNDDEDDEEQDQEAAVVDNNDEYDHVPFGRYDNHIEEHLMDDDYDNESKDEQGENRITSQSRFR